jgi:acetyltransferase
MNAPSHTLTAAVPRTPLRAAQWLLRALPYRRLHRTDDRQRLPKAHLDAQSLGLPQDCELPDLRTERSEPFRTAPDSIGTTRAAAVARQAQAPIATGRGQAVAPSRRHVVPVPDSEAGLAGVRVRVAQPSDIGPLQQLYATLSTHTRAQRFFSPLRELPREMLNALESGDPAHRFLVVERPEAEGNGTLLGLGQYVVEPGQARCELALLIGDEWQGCGLGTRLLDKLLEDAVASGMREARLETLHGNLAMRALARRAGFSVRTHPEDSRLLLACRALAGQSALAMSPGV